MKFFDVHNDVLTQRENINSYLSPFYKDGQSKIVLAIFISEKKLSVEKIFNLIKKIKDKNNTYFAIEDISSIPYDDLPKLKIINPLYCSLTWNHSNSLAGGAYSNSNITKLGYKYIDKIEEFSFVDTAHLNKKSFYSLAKYSKKPLLNSHTNLVKFHHHKRNINNFQIKAIIKSNGLVCLTGVKEFLGKNSTLKTYVDSIYYFYKKYGCNNLALSTDFLGSREFPLFYHNYKDFSIIYNSLKEKGLNELDLEKIFYLNAFNFFKLSR